MNPFVDQTMQYLATVVESAAGSRSIRSPALVTHNILPNDAYYSASSGSPPCSPLVMSSPTFTGDLLDFCDQQSNLQPSEHSYASLRSLESTLERPSFNSPLHSEADASLLSPTPDSLHPGPARPAGSVLFQSSSSASADVSLGPQHSQVGLHNFDKRMLSDEPAQSFESVVYTLAAEALSVSGMHWPLADLLKEHALQEALERLNDAEDAVALRQCVVLTDIGFHLNEITTKLRAYDIDRENLTSIADKMKQVEAAAQSQSISLNSTGSHCRPSKPRHRLPFLQRNGLLLTHLPRLLDSTKHLRRMAATFVSDQIGFPWRHSEPPSQSDAVVV